MLRSDVPWVKRSAMPESVQNRPAKALEYVFLLAKGEGYLFDMEAVRREAKPESEARYAYDFGSSEKDKEQRKLSGSAVGAREYTGGRAFGNADLWFESVTSPHGLCGVEDDLVGLDVISEAYPGKHFATFGRKLITPLILSGTSERGCCPKCGAPWRRLTAREGGERAPEDKRGVRDRSLPSNHNGSTGSLDGKPASVSTVGWEPTCRHTDDEGCPLDPVPCVVLDLFAGLGTTPAVAASLGRRGWGIELSQTYLNDLAVARVQQELVRIGREDLFGGEPKEKARKPVEF